MYIFVKLNWIAILVKLYKQFINCIRVEMIHFYIVIEPRYGSPCTYFMTGLCFWGFWKRESRDRETQSDRDRDRDREKQRQRSRNRDREGQRDREGTTCTKCEMYSLEYCTEKSLSVSELSRSLPRSSSSTPLFRA